MKPERSKTLNWSVFEGHAKCEKVVEIVGYKI